MAIPWNKGIKTGKQSNETIEKRVNSRKGYKHSEFTKNKIGKSNSLSLKGKAPWNKGLKTGNTYWKGKHRPNISGEKCYAWKGGITPINLKIRNSLEYKEWRESVFKRDNYTCQCCSDNKGGNLNAHHIKEFSKFPKLRMKLANGITLCKKCHVEKHKTLI